MLKYQNIYVRNIYKSFTDCETPFRNPELLFLSLAPDYSSCVHLRAHAEALFFLNSCWGGGEGGGMQGLQVYWQILNITLQVLTPPPPRNSTGGILQLT